MITIESETDSQITVRYTDLSEREEAIELLRDLQPEWVMTLDLLPKSYEEIGDIYNMRGYVGSMRL